VLSVNLSRRRGRKRTRGQGLVEFAIVLPVIVLVVMGLMDLGRGIYTYNTLSQSSRQAARTAIVNQVTTTIKAQAIASGATLGLTTSDVDVCFKTENTTKKDCSTTTDNCPQTSRVIGCLAIVKTHVSYAPFTPVVALLFSTINLSSTSVEPIEYVCPTGTATTC
jgi:Flp pilus assembly protein TadG